MEVGKPNDPTKCRHFIATEEYIMHGHTDGVPGDCRLVIGGGACIMRTNCTYWKAKDE